jgi:hypothetical protein
MALTQFLGAWKFGMEFKTTRSDDPHFFDPRFQRRVIESHRPLGFIENMHDVKFECGHSPLIFCVPDPQAGGVLLPGLL